MQRILKERRISPALVISMIALFVAIGGVAGALPGKNTVNSGDIKKNGVKSSDIKNDNVKGADVQESSLGKVPSAATADVATTGSPAAYAAVEGDGTLSGGYAAKNISAATVSNPDTGSYCFDLPFVPTTGSANATHQGEVDEDGLLTIELVAGNYIDCPASAEAEVRNLDVSGAVAQADSFMVLFHS